MNISLFLTPLAGLFLPQKCLLYLSNRQAYINASTMALIFCSYEILILGRLSRGLSCLSRGLS